MVGLEADALINYYQAGNIDARIPSAIKCVADYLLEQRVERGFNRHKRLRL